MPVFGLVMPCKYIHAFSQKGRHFSGRDSYATYFRNSREGYSHRHGSCGERVSGGMWWSRRWAKTAGKAMSASASATPSPSSDLLFTKGKINKNDFSSALISSVKKMTMYHMDGSTNFAESGEKHTIKLSSDYDGRDQAKPKAHMLMSEPGEGKKVEVVVIGKDIYKKSGSKWVKSPHSGDGMGLADIAETLRTSSKAIDSVTYVGQEPRGHRFDVVLDPAKLGGGKRQPPAKRA